MSERSEAEKSVKSKKIRQRPLDIWKEQTKIHQYPRLVGLSSFRVIDLFKLKLYFKIP